MEECQIFMRKLNNLRIDNLKIINFSNLCVHLSEARKKWNLICLKLKLETEFKNSFIINKIQKIKQIIKLI